MFFEISEKIKNLSSVALEKAKPVFSGINELTEYNQQKVLSAFIRNRVDETDFNTTTGYGYSDKGREKLDVLVADIFGTESAIIRAGALASGTHTLAVCLYGILRPNDTMLCVTGTPYDTLHSTIGLNGKNMGDGTLADFGINYAQVDLTVNDEIDYDAVEKCASDKSVRMVYIQRSRGYSLRHTISIAEIEKVCEIVHRVNKRAIVMVDNCYGEFVETREPTEVGVDVMVGSLIKNAGGGIAPTGAYIVGKKEVVELVSSRFIAPNIGLDVGSYAGSYTPFFQGCFLAPHTTLNALKGNILLGRVAEKLGFVSYPKFGEIPHDLVRTFELQTEDNLVDFCRMIQRLSPVDSSVVPYPWDMPGYDDKVIMAAGSFIQGSSIELSADGPIREPFLAYLQGGLTYEHLKIVSIKFAERYLSI